ncbi:hypothetical protein C8R46DRAFT_1221744 [Mycena filopes]|nr:hypothetical protein C8R46DRAFT_1221744 [Mycena filopes]
MCKRSLSCRFLRRICHQPRRCVTARCPSRLPVDLAGDFVGYAPASASRRSLVLLYWHRSTFPASSTAPHDTLPPPRPHHFLDDGLDAGLFDFDPTRSRSILNCIHDNGAGGCRRSANPPCPRPWCTPQSP